MSEIISMEEFRKQQVENRPGKVVAYTIFESVKQNVQVSKTLKTRGINLLDTGWECHTDCIWVNSRLKTRLIQSEKSLILVEENNKIRYKACSIADYISQLEQAH